jgi:hypothetical protein
MEKLSTQPETPQSFKILQEAKLPYTIVSEEPFQVQVPMGVKDITDTRQILTKFTDALEEELGAKSSHVAENPNTKTYYIEIHNQ